MWPDFAQYIYIYLGQISLLLFKIFTFLLTLSFLLAHFSVGGLLKTENVNTDTDDVQGVSVQYLLTS